MKSIKTALFGIFAAFILSACGGGGGGNTPTVLIPVNPPAVNPPTDNPPADNPPAENFNTAEFRGNYGLASIRADSAYKADAFGQGVTVAVMDSGILTSHIDLRDNIVEGYDYAADTDIIDDPEGHGTAVAGVIGARRGNGGVHGVAPSVRIVPLQIGDKNGDIVGNAIHTAISDGITIDGAHIINASFGGDGSDYFYGEYQGNRYWFEIPGVAAVLNDDYTDYANDFADVVRGEDVVVVWAAGNSGWHPGGRKVIYRANCNDATNSECIDTNVGTRISDAQVANFRLLTHTDGFGNLRSFGDFAARGHSVNISLRDVRADIFDLSSSLSSFESSVPLWAVDNIRQLFDDFNDGTITAQQLNDAVLADPDFVSTAQRWLAVAAVDENNRIASFSNGCGAFSFLWCIAAPGVNISTTAAGNNGQQGNNLYDTVDGTSFAAPHVSGALALLKSAAPELPMREIQFILLTTATDLGEEGVDAIYGWGLVNISAGIDHIENMETANGLALSSLRGSLPSEMSHLRGHLSEVSVALRITDNSYYNMPLSAVLPKAESSSQAVRVAAEGLMTADYAAGESFRFWGGLDYDADGGSRFLSESGGVFGAAESSDTAGYVRWASADYDGFSLFGEYEYADINADYGGDSFIQSVRGARAEGWMAGMRFADIWKFGDSLRLSATDETALSGGKMILRYPVADGDGHAAFIGGTPQTIRMKETRIPLKRQRTMIYAIGYGREYESGKWSAAAAYNEHTNTTAFSIQLHTEF